MPLAQAMALLTITGMGGWIFRLFRQSVFPAYIIAGMALGPQGLNLLDTKSFEIMGEMGILAMLFCAALKFDIRSFAKTGQTAVWLLFFQVVCSFFFCLACQTFLEMDRKQALLWVFVCTLSSTVCAVKMMEFSFNFYDVYAMSVLLIQDIALSAMLMFLQFADNLANMSFFQIFLEVMLQIAPLASILFLSHMMQGTKKWDIKETEENCLLICMACLGVATLFYKNGLSPEYGAFIGGFLLGIFWDPKQASHTVEPTATMLSSIFFVCIGLKANLIFMYHYFELIALVASLLFLFKSLVNVAGLYVATGDTQSVYSGFLLSVLGELSLVLIEGVGRQDFHTDLLTSAVVICTLFSSTWFGLLFERKKVV